MCSGQVVGSSSFFSDKETKSSATSAEFNSIHTLLGSLFISSNSSFSSIINSFSIISFSSSIINSSLIFSSTFFQKNEVSEFTQNSIV
ncbi:MAG: hypothetical protein P1U46_04685 [Patescibacteria group bacterium]|nr:hypothetical protein [Patescibacteria group bacterium]